MLLCEQSSSWIVFLGIFSVIWRAQ